MSTVRPSSAFALDDIWPAGVAPEGLPPLDEQPVTARAVPKAVSFTSERTSSMLDFMVCSSELLDWADANGVSAARPPEKSAMDLIAAECFPEESQPDQMMKLAMARVVQVDPLQL